MSEFPASNAWKRRLLHTVVQYVLDTAVASSPRLWGARC